ncbi:unnamed protein product (macronuclear) [Paramecium tetraurelia]|uniref:Uncharacterized protein n=1 Tax=Paramecium tetraurelia TaxID=5888 RepID=A0E145_PARTE|nr:uncharacterized protein GSPATT00022181001 [Paramecium tetraurelia]CAK89012.1 unnamed protein product [Paramecium tetraurelia]|eukprot:XP_001456409.1 hypothetical protein (macronuclear) [Paramecium tetraurelia strain d4-2]
MHNIKKSKYRLKDVIEGKTSNDEKSAQKFVQLSHIKKNVQEFNQLKSTLQDRKVTFAKFAFRQQELIDDKKLGPVLKGICNRTRIGSMQITELIPKFDLYKFLKQSHLEPSKRVLRRYAHWEWDQEQEERKEVPPSYKFTSKTEFEYKKKMETKDADKKLRKDIIKKWASSLPDVCGLTAFGKQFTMQSSPLISTKTTLSKTHTYFSPNPRSETVQFVSGLIHELDEIKLDNLQIRKKLRGTQCALQKIIEKQQQQKVAHMEINGE